MITKQQKIDAAKSHRLSAIVAVSLFAGCGFAAAAHAATSDIQKVTHALLGLDDESDRHAPIDYGAGPGVKPAPATAAFGTARALSPARPAAVPVGGANANVTGVFGAAVSWPIIMIHAVVLPDGRVLNYGTDEKGVQGAQLIYDIWNPNLGTGTTSHLVLSNTTGTDLFCSAQAVLQSGQVLLTGGDLTLNGKRNYARNDTNIFTPVGNSLTSNTPMNYARWYGSLLPLPNGQFLVSGGYQNQAAPLMPAIPATVPELYDPATQSWTALPGASSATAFGNFNNDWYYPRTVVVPGGGILLISNDGPMYSLSTAGTGSIITLPGKAPPGIYDLPTVPYAAGKLLSLRQIETVTIDYSKATPVITKIAPIDQLRHWANGTILADGQVVITGGSLVRNALTGVDYTAQIWNPATSQWTAGAVAAKPRLYHSNAILLQDGTVLTGGGGAPGPVNNLNAEIYYPPYLYTSAGAPAVRPSLTGISTSVAPGGTVTASVGPTDVVTRLTFLRSGSSTHSNNPDQRFFDLPFTQEGQNLSAVVPTDGTVLIAGYYLLFAFNAAGVPSLAQVVIVT